MHFFNFKKTAILFALVGLSFIFFFLTHNAKPNYNVILIVVDTLRADHMGLYGYYRNTTPYIDNFARDAVGFDNAITAASWTMPSFTSMLTSQHARNLFFLPSEINLTLKPLTLATYFPLLPRIQNVTTSITDILYYNNYSTAAFFAVSALKYAGLDENFKVYDTEGELGNKTSFETYGTIKKINKRIIDWVYANKDEKFFLMIDYGDVHCPYDPPKEFNVFYPASAKNTSKYDCEFRFPESNISEEDIDVIRAAYDGDILYVDHYIGDLLYKINNIGLDKNTIIVITADHGEELAYHYKFLGHLEPLYQSVARVPLIIKYPDVKKGLRINSTVSLIDLAPTILDILNLDIPKEFEGESLVPLIEGKKKFNRPVFISGFPRTSVNSFQYTGIAVIDENNYKFISYSVMNYLNKSSKEELYDLNIDPNETKNLINGNNEKARELKEKILLFLMHSVEKSKYVARKVKEKSDTIRQISEREEEGLLDALRRLGYLT